jgi:hypothetical protein
MQSTFAAIQSRQPIRFLGRVIPIRPTFRSVRLFLTRLDRCSDLLFAPARQRSPVSDCIFASLQKTMYLRASVDQKSWI